MLLLLLLLLLLLWFDLQESWKANQVLPYYGQLARGSEVDMLLVQKVTDAVSEQCNLFLCLVKRSESQQVRCSESFGQPICTYSHRSSGFSVILCTGALKLFMACSASLAMHMRG